MDAFSDTWFRTTNRVEIINDMWREVILKKLADSFAARLIPLNKVWPEIPRGD
jgi:hypothetical protein